jgi:hypothetical protein
MRQGEAMKLVTCYGGVFRLTEAEYEKALRDIINGGECELPSNRYIGDIKGNFTDITGEEAKGMMEDLQEERRNARKERRK